MCILATKVCYPLTRTDWPLIRCRIVKKRSNVIVGRKLWFPAMLLCLILLSSCGTESHPSSSSSPSSDASSRLNDKLHIAQQTNTTGPMMVFPKHDVTPTPTAQIPTNIPRSGTGAAPYGPPPPMTAEETQLTQQLFALINSDRAARGLYPYTWNATLAGGARLHSWNMYHCGFSHTCPDGRTQCQRIADEGFAGYTDCGECIGYAGPFPTPYDGMHNIQESMVNEPPTGWHRIHLLSTTLHRVGVGIYVDPQGYIWFTEDLVS